MPEWLEQKLLLFPLLQPYKSRHSVRREKPDLCALFFHGRHTLNRSLILFNGDALALQVTLP